MDRNAQAIIVKLHWEFQFGTCFSMPKRFTLWGQAERGWLRVVGSSRADFSGTELAVCVPEGVRVMGVEFARIA